MYYTQVVKEWDPVVKLPLLLSLSLGVRRSSALTISSTLAVPFTGPSILRILEADPNFMLNLPDVLEFLFILSKGYEVLEVLSTIVLRRRINRNRGLNVGRQVQIMPTDCSTDDHVAVSTVVYVGSAWSERLKAMIRSTDTMQTLW